MFAVQYSRLFLCSDSGDSRHSTAPYGIGIPVGDIIHERLRCLRIELGELRYHPVGFFCERFISSFSLLEVINGNPVRSAPLNLISTASGRTPDGTDEEIALACYFRIKLDSLAGSFVCLSVLCILVAEYSELIRIVGVLKIVGFRIGDSLLKIFYCILDISLRTIEPVKEIS